MHDFAFIGLGNMGSGMAINLAKSGSVIAFDLSETALQHAEEQGLATATTVAQAASQAKTIVTMLPAGPHVKSVYMDTDGVFANAQPGSLLIDCSTIDVDSARTVAQAASEQGFRFADAPVSGGVAAANDGQLTFMVGCHDADFADVETVLTPMAKAVIRAGDHGAGQAAKICNNMLLAIHMIGTAEAFALADKLGLDADRFYEISSKSSGQNWSMTSYCPVPGPVPTSPANNGYKAGFAADMMLKDLKLAADAAAKSGASTLMGGQAESLYALFSNLGYGHKDFSGVMPLISGDLEKLAD